MRIGFLTTKINFEGAGGSVPDLDCKVRSMQEFGNESFVVTLFSELNALPALPYRVYERRVRAKEKTWFAVQREVFATLRAYRRQADIFHVEGSFVYGAAFHRLLGGKPVVVFYNREMTVWESGNGLRAIFRRAVEKTLCRTLTPVADCHYFTTPFLAQMYFEFGLRLQPGQYSVLVDFFDPATMRASVAGSVREEAPDTIVLFASGRMIEQKGFHLLVEAVAMLPDSLRARIKVVIGGDGPEREKVMRLAQQLGVADIMSFPGWMAKQVFSARLAHCDVFVLPRWRIEQPSVIVEEALALGVPIVAPGGGGVEWMAADAMVPFTDSDAQSLARALEKSIGSAGERERLRSAAKKRWETLDPAVRAKDLDSIFKKAASGV